MNYRTSGRKTAGRVVKGVTRTNTTVPTIPTKYVTILNPDCHEKKGFGQQASRFAAPVEHEGPEPGSYFHPVDYDLKSDSFSKKGYGDFASTSSRFQRLKPPTRVGPGEYETTSTLSTKSIATASFKQPINTQTRSFDTPGPGAYTRSVVETHWVDKGDPTSASFKSSSKRALPSTPSIDGNYPGPGNYTKRDQFDEIGQRMRVRPSTEGLQSRKRPPVPALEGDPMFTQRTMTGYQTNRSRRTNRSRQHKSSIDSSRYFMPSSAFQSRSKRTEWSKHTAFVPGVGSYDPYVQHVPQYDEIKESANFSVTAVDRFGEPYDKPRWDTHPGPGSYDPERCYNKQLLDLDEVADLSTVSPQKATRSQIISSPQNEKTWGDKRRKPGTLPIDLVVRHNSSVLHPSSMFLSETQRDTQKRTYNPQSLHQTNNPRSSIPVVENLISDVKPPGPAYYSPEIPRKQSFRNPEKTEWV
ncbi:hypothetical protein BLNAU_16005 [Blattamonas nauphoetae]|uniref:Uncharacterized protein n=1 Tax=Blattamonas nauphoetae TaxID=2049346 RepID=A0ABQ9XCL2_9EUKA|nr:hypothetical protein BLNAU_16005 [Blattamonas nauphoetae]